MNRSDPDRNDLDNSVSRSTDKSTQAGRPSKKSGRKQMEERIHFQARLLDAVGQAVIATDLQGKVVYWNQAAEELYGWSAGEAMGRSGLESTAPESLWEQADEVMSELRATRRWSGEYEMRRKNGKLFQAEITITPVLDDEDNLVGIIGVSADITDRKEAEEELKRLSRQHQLILNSAGEGIYGLDREGTATFVNPAAAALTGFEAEELVGQHLHDVVHHSYPDGTHYPEEDCLIYAALRDGKAHHVTDEVFWRKDGTSFPVEYTSTPLLENGEITGAVVTFTDITERKQADERLREAEQKYRTLVEQIPAVTYIDRADGSDEPLYTSPHIEHMLGYSPQEWLERRLWPERLHPHDKGRILAADERFEAGGDSFSEEYRLIAKDGSVVWVREEAVVLRDEAGEPLYWQGVIFDITERKEAEARLRESEERFRALTQNSSDIVTLLNVDGTILYESPSIERILGYELQELVGKNAFDYVHPDDLERVLEVFAEGLANSALRPTVEYRFRHKDGSWRWLESIGTNMLDDPAVGELVVNSRDVSERKEAEERLKTSETELRALFAAMDDVVFEIDAQGRILKVAPTNWLLRYRTREELLGKTLHDILPTNTAEELLAHIRRSVESRETVKTEYSLAIEGKEQWIEGAVTPLSQDSVVFVGRDITERKALEERLAHQASHDPLTNLPNRTLLTDRLRQALARIRRRGLSLAVMFMDLDNFKVINDSLGHRMGDRLLVSATKRIRSVLRPEDTVARLGGDELVFLLEDTDLDGAIQVAERILEVLREPFTIRGRELFVTASLGITVSDGHGKNPPDLLRDADLAMYRAKHSGKARYVLFEETMNTRALERLELEHGLRRAVERNEFVVHYQPNVSLATGKIVFFEALARWEDPERGLLPPDEFVPLAEETGLIIPIGEAVLEEACHRAKDWQEQRPSDPPAVCVNLSARQFWEISLADTVERILHETDLDPHYLCLEITESTAMSDAPVTAATLEVLQDLGVRAIIDDFGTGYSSLSYLERFPVDYVKIDRSFVGGLAEESGAAVLASGVISLAHALDLKVIAEGVETEEQLERLREMKCDLAQGHLFSEPLTAKEVANLLVAVHHRNLLDRS
jgi:diguanylate cyclase (GGDEF)-like protein/PAS domain S-box-containing protein